MSIYILELIHYADGLCEMILRPLVLFNSFGKFLNCQLMFHEGLKAHTKVRRSMFNMNSKTFQETRQSILGSDGMTQSDCPLIAT